MRRTAFGNLSGTEQEHEREYASALRNFNVQVNAHQTALRRKDCVKAANALMHANRIVGEMDAHADYSSLDVNYFKDVREDFVPRLMELRDQFIKVCVRRK